MTLSMKNYKGFDKLPYCGAHVPKAKATTVVDTPEMRRLAENSKIQVRTLGKVSRKGVVCRQTRSFVDKRGRCTFVVLWQLKYSVQNKISPFGN